MFQTLYNLLLDGIFDGVLPSPLIAYCLEFFTLVCISIVVGLPFFLVYGFLRRWM